MAYGRAAQRFNRIQGKAVGVALLLSAALLGGWMAWFKTKPELIRGIVWQVDNKTVDIAGSWHQLGARRLLVQWSVVDGLAFIPGTGLPPAPKMPDWQRIGAQPWAQEVILGLAGSFKEREAREGMAQLAALSATISDLAFPLNIVGWYFPVEIDPTWSDAPRMAPLLVQLPRPLWVSVYDSANVGADVLADWLTTWLPDDVGVFFQDGVGVHARDASTARHYADTLATRLGPSRLRLIVEAFRPDANGGFRSATPDELGPQMSAYVGHELYLFDGPHYISDDLVDQLKRVP
jgi:hypothetical protein